MATLARLLVELGMDPKKFNEGLSSAEGKLKQTGKKLMNIGGGLTSGLTNSIVGMGYAAINAASDLNESASAVETVFGSTADSVFGMQGSVAESLGLTRQEALGAAGALGAIMKGAGVAEEHLADMSNQVIQSAADLGSFYNVPVPEALAAIQSGLTGETEPLKRFGILLNDAAVQQAALTHGIWDGTGAMTEAQKVQARYFAIMDAMGPAAGDFARTSGGLANKLRIVKAQINDATAMIGQQLLPIVLRIVSALSVWIQKFNDLSPRIQKWILIIGGILAVIGPVILALGAFATALSAIISIAPAVGTAMTLMLGPWGLVLIAVAAVVAIFATDFMGIRTYVMEVVNFVIDGIKQLIDWFGEGGFGQIVNALGGFAKKLIEFGTEAILFYFSLPLTIAEQLIKLIDPLKQFVSDAIDAIGNLKNKIVDGLGDAKNILFSWGADLIQGLVNGIWSKIEALKDAIQGVMDAGLNKIKDFWDFGSPSKLLEQYGKWAVQGWNKGAASQEVRMPWLQDGGNIPSTGSAWKALGRAASGIPRDEGQGGFRQINLGPGAVVVHSPNADPDAVADRVVWRLRNAVDRIEAGAGA